MSDFSHVNVAVEDRPAKPFKYSHVVNTTANFGGVQTLNCQFVPLGQTKVKFNNSSTVRCSPIVAPTFGGMQQHCFHSFVGVSDIYPYYNEVLGQKPVNLYPGETSIIRNFPYSYTHFITLCLLRFCHVRVFKSNIDTHGNELDYIPQSESDYDTYYYDMFAPLFAGDPHIYQVPQVFRDSFKPSYVENPYTDEHPELLLAYSPDSADFILKPDFAYPGTQIDPFIICFYLTENGKMLYKHLIGCGYKFTLNYNESIKVSILPILAVAKAYFDNFRIAAYDNYTETPMYDLYQHYYRSHPNGCVSTNGEFDSVEYNCFLQILAYLSMTYYSEDVDYISCQIPITGDKPATDGTTNFSRIKIKNSYDNGQGGNSVGNRFRDGSNSDDSQPAFIAYQSGFTQLDDEILKKLYYWINQTSKVGFQLRDLLIQRGYSQYVDECKSSFIGHDINDIVIDSVVSLASTAQAPLGEFAGRAVAYNENRYYEYDCPEIGFVISMMSIVCGKNVVGQLNPQLLGTDPFTVYNPQLDGLGLESVPKAIVGKVNQFFDGNDTNVRDAEIFGLSPRFSGFKTAGNSAVANGDMLRFRFRDNYAPYYLDRLMTPRRVHSVYNEQSQGYHMAVDGNTDIWQAGKEWRFPCKYGWMGNFNRIFHVYDEKLAALPADYYEIVDNFIIHNYIDFTAFARMLPIADSWDTQEDEGKQPTISVNQ